MKPPAAMGWRRLAGWTLVSLALLTVFVAYLQPDMAFTLANWAWSCL